MSAELPPIPPIEICGGCPEASMLDFINAENQHFVRNAVFVRDLLSATEKAHDGVLPEEANDTVKAVEEARKRMASERAVVDEVNAIGVCKMAGKCVRLLRYKAVPGGVYLGQSYVDFTAEDLFGMPDVPPSSPEQ